MVFLNVQLDFRKTFINHFFSVCMGVVTEKDEVWKAPNLIYNSAQNYKWSIVKLSPRGIY